MSENLKSHSVLFCCNHTPLLKISTKLLISIYIRIVIKCNSSVIQHTKKRSFSFCRCYELLMPHSALRYPITNHKLSASPTVIRLSLREKLGVGLVFKSKVEIWVTLRLAIMTGCKTEVITFSTRVFPSTA